MWQCGRLVEHALGSLWSPPMLVQVEQRAAMLTRICAVQRGLTRCNFLIETGNFQNFLYVLQCQHHLLLAHALVSL